MSQKIRFINRDDLYKNIDYLKTGVFWSIWGIVKYIPSPLGDIIRCFVLKLFLKKLKSWRIKEGVFIVFPEKISIGKECGINEYCHLDGRGEIEIGNYVMIGHHTTINTTDHQIDGNSEPMRYSGMLVGKIVIEDDVYIGAKVFISKGVKIGKGAVIGAGSIITKDVPARAIFAGNPAQLIRFRDGKKILRDI